MNLNFILMISFISYELCKQFVFYYVTTLRIATACYLTNKYQAWLTYVCLIDIEFIRLMKKK